MALLLVTQLLPAVAWADGQLQLLLPIVTAMAFGVSAVESTAAEVERRRAPRFLASPPPRGGQGLLPQRLRIPDGYAIDLERTPPRFVEPVDSDRVVSFDVVSRPLRGWTASLAYDEEARGPFPSSGEVIRFVTEFRF